MRMFGENYVKFKNFFELGNVLYIKGKYQARWGKEGDLELKPSEVRLLETVGDELTESLSIWIDADILNEKLLNDIELLCQNKKGKHRLKMVLFSKAEKLKVNLSSRTYSIHADTEFVEHLNKLGLKYRIN